MSIEKETAKGAFIEKLLLIENTNQLLLELLINKIDQFRKLGDFFAMIIFFCISFYLYQNNYYVIH